jgi:hypothetical protein
VLSEMFFISAGPTMSFGYCDKGQFHDIFLDDSTSGLFFG